MAEDERPLTEASPAGWTKAGAPSSKQAESGVGWGVHCGVMAKDPPNLLPVVAPLDRQQFFQGIWMLFCQIKVDLTCRPWLPRFGLVSPCRGETPPIPTGLRIPMRLGGMARGGIWNCLCPRRATPTPTDPAMGRELEPKAHLEKHRERKSILSVARLSSGLAWVHVRGRHAHRPFTHTARLQTGPSPVPQVGHP